jgi:hypothetical protein
VVYANVNDMQSESDLFRRFWQEHKVASFADPRVATAVIAIKGEKSSKIYISSKTGNILTSCKHYNFTSMDTLLQRQDKLCVLVSLHSGACSVE